MGVLAAWCAYRFYREKIGSMQVLEDCSWASAWWPTPMCSFYLPPIGFMIALAYVHDRESWRHHWKSLLVGTLVFLILTLAFYVPFIRDPNFQRAQEYFAQDRIGTQFLYNGLQSMVSQDSDYSTRYYAPLLVLFAGLVVVRELLKLGRRGAWLAAIIVLAAATTLYWPSAWQWGTSTAHFTLCRPVPDADAVSPHIIEVKSLSLWFGVPFLALEFLAKDAADHVQIAYPAWILLAALGLEFFWQQLVGTPGRILKAATVAILACILGLILTYQHLEFLGRVTDYWSAKADSENKRRINLQRLIWRPPPATQAVPATPAWEVEGSRLFIRQWRAARRLSQRQRIVRRANLVHASNSALLLRRSPELLRGDWPQRRACEMKKLSAAGYSLTRIVRVDRQPKLYLLEKSVPAAGQPKVYDVDDYGALFDLSATRNATPRKRRPNIACRPRSAAKCGCKATTLTQRSLRRARLWR